MAPCWNPADPACKHVSLTLVAWPGLPRHPGSVISHGAEGMSPGQCWSAWGFLGHLTAFCQLRRAQKCGKRKEAVEN